MLEGVFEPVAAAEVRFAPATPTLQFRVVQAVAHGTAVRKGDVLVRGEAGKLEQAVRMRELDLAAAAVKLQQAQEELQHLERTVRPDVATAERARARVEEDFERFTKAERSLAQRDANQEVTNRLNALEYAREELRQLEKMYKADDLVSETEEIVLRRQRNTVELYTFLLEKARTAREKVLRVDLPRADEDWAMVRSRAAENERNVKAALPLKLAAQRAETARLQAAHEQTGRDLADVKADLAAMTLAAPADGVAYYGRCVRGAWPAAAAAEAKLAPGGLIAAQEVAITIVQGDGLAVRAAVEERHLHRLSPGQEWTVVPTGYPERKLAATVESVAAAVLPSGKFDVRFKLSGDVGPLRAGMTCSVRMKP